MAHISYLHWLDDRSTVSSDTLTRDQQSVGGFGPHRVVHRQGENARISVTFWLFSDINSPVNLGYSKIAEKLI